MPRFKLPIEYPFAAEAAAALGYAGRKLGKALDALAAGSSTTFRMTSGKAIGPKLEPAGRAKPR